MAKPRLLDLFCGAGGSARGYQQAGFHVTGVDLRPMPRYAGDLFVQGDALHPPVRLEDFDVIHASPPCQAYSQLRVMHPSRSYPDLIGQVRDMLQASGRPYIIENVEGAPLRDAVRVCGSAFGLDVRRHRRFESNLPLWSVPCHHGWQRPRFANTGTRRRALLSSVVGVYGGSHFKGDNLAYRSEAMGIDWMQMDELSEAIPPAFAAYLGQQILERLESLPLVSLEEM